MLLKVKINPQVKYKANLYYYHVQTKNTSILKYMSISCGRTVWSVTIQTEQHEENTSTSNVILIVGLFGDDVDGHDRLTVPVFGFTDVVSKVDGLHVLHGHDTLGDPCGVTHVPVNQPPGGEDVNRTKVLHNKTNMAAV